MTRPEAATTPEPGDATAVIPLTRVGDRYVGRRRHDETIETWKYTVVFGAGFALWLFCLLAGSYLMTHGWR